jgi:DNA invertase Pin-like site-specific DNA recombinase
MQADKGLSIPAQLEEIRRWAGEHGYEILEEFVDDAYSGKDADRPAFQDMLAKLREGREVRAVICWKSSRFARNVEQAAAFRGLLKRKGVELLTVAEPSVEGPTGVIVSTLLDAMNEFYSLQLAEEVVRGQKEAVRQGGVPGGAPPYGFRKERQGRHLKYVPQEDEAEVVRKIYRWYGEGVSMIEIARRLDEQRAPVRRGGKWSSAYVRKILTVHTKVYLGNVVYGKTRQPGRGETHIQRDEREWLVIEGAHEAIITPQEVEAVELTRQGRPAWQNLNRNTRVRGVALLKGLLVCEQCGCKASSTVSNGRRYYVCGSRLLRQVKGIEVPRHDSPWLRVDLLDPRVMEMAKEHITREIIEKVREALQEEEPGKGEPEGKRGEIERRIQRLQKKRGRLVGAIAEGILQGDDAREQMKEIREQLDVAERELEELQEGEEDFSEWEVLLEEAIQSPEGKEALALALINEVVFGWGEVVIRYKLLFPEDRIQLRV